MILKYFFFEIKNNNTIRQKKNDVDYDTLG